MAQLSIEHALQVAVRHHQAGRLAEAEQLYRQVLACQPDHADALHLLGVTAHQAGRNEIAVDLIRRAIAHRPDFPEAHNNLGNVLKGLGQADEASAAYRQAIALRPQFPEAHNNLGLALKDAGQPHLAIAAYRQAIALRPEYPEAHNNLGRALQDAGQLEDALTSCRRAIALRPNYSEAHNNLGAILFEMEQPDQAIAAYRRAVTLRPNYAEAQNNLGVALLETGQLHEAIAAYRQAIALKSDYPDAYGNLGAAFFGAGQPDAAAAAYRQAIALRPGDPAAHLGLGLSLKETGQLEEAIAVFRQAIALVPDSPQAGSNLVYTMHFHAGCTAREIADEQRRWEHRHADPLKQSIRPHANDRNPDRRLRIGYVSPDFREHPVGRFLAPLLAHHDHQSFEIFAYAQVAAPDSVTRRLRSHTDCWKSINGLSHEQAADLVRQDQIDVLVDLTMHMARNRLLVFAQKPAPVQVTYLAYCSSTGLGTIDYRLSDPWLDPLGSAPFNCAQGGQPEKDELIYSEQTIRLPATYWCYEPHTDMPDVGSLPALEQAHITFGCLNTFSKVSEPVLAAWASLLRAVPGSQFLLHAHQGSHRQRVHDRFEREGVEPSRVRFVSYQPVRQYFELYGHIDIALDTFPYAGGTTTCDALWMGAPVVSLAGGTAVGRSGLSILSNIGLPELVARSEEAYVRIAAELANDLPRLSNLRSTLRQRMRHSPLMDAPRFAGNVEAAYRRMWQTWCSGNTGQTGG